MRWSLERNGALSLVAVLMFWTVPAHAGQPFDTTPPFTDDNYHEYLLYDPDTPHLDVLIMPPVTGAALRDVEVIEQSIRYWGEGIQELGQPWFAEGFRMDWHRVGFDPVPAEALDDPEIVVVTATYNPIRFGLLGVGLQLPVTICHGQDPLASDVRTMPGFHQHEGSQWGTFRAQCNGGGYTCFVVNMEQIGNTEGQRRNQFDLNSHEFGHCLGIGHVGDALDFSAAAFPSKDIMSYAVGNHVHCVSSLNLRSLEFTYAHLLGRVPQRNTAGGYIHMDPADYVQVDCAEPTTPWLTTTPVEEADPLGMDQQDSDGDGVSDDRDACPGHDDGADADGDGTPDGCDGDNSDGPLGDADGDGVANAADACPGHDDRLDGDGDGIPDGCDSVGPVSYYLRAPDDGVFVANLDQVTHGAGILSTESPPDLGYAMALDNSVLVGTTAPNTLAELVWQTASPVNIDGTVDIVIFAEATANPFHALDCGGLEAKLWTHDGAWRLLAPPLEMDLPGPALPGDRLVLRGSFGEASATGTLAVAINADSLDCGAGITVFYDDVDFASRIEVAPIAPPDRDGDGVPDAVDAFPDDASEWLDSDGDGVGDNADACAGAPDGEDADADGLPDACDDDRDGDGAENSADAFPDDPAEWQDSDADGVGDNSDQCPGSDDALDWDDDGTPDGCDAPPRIRITSPSDGETVGGAFIVEGSTDGTAAQTQNVRIPDVFAMDPLPPGIVVEGWMHGVRDRLAELPGHRGLLPVPGVLHWFVDGEAVPAVTLPDGWRLEVHGVDVAPLSLRVDRGLQFAPELPRGGVVSQGLGPGTPLYIQMDGDRSSVGICTANYLWKDHEARIWLGAAGHCFLPPDVTNADGTFDLSRVDVFACRSDCVLGGVAGAQQFFLWQDGFDVGDFVGLGQVGYARQNGVGQDFGIVAVPAGSLADLEPEMPGFGGPYGIDRDGFVGEPYFYHGNGLIVGESAGTKSRIGIGDGDGGDKTSWAMIGSANGGDSGSAVNSFSPLQPFQVGTGNPAARGILTHGYADPFTGLVPTIPIVFGTTVGQAQAMANEAGLCIVPVFANEDPAVSPPAPMSAACRAADVPGIVTGVAATAGDASVSLAWAVPPDNGAPITSFTVRYGAGDLDRTLVVAEPAATVSGLENDVLYTFTVAATNAAGDGPASAPVTAIPQAQVRFEVEVRIDNGSWAAADSYDPRTEDWQHGWPDMPDGTYLVTARLLHSGTPHDSASVRVIVFHDEDADGVGDAEDVCPGHHDGADLDGDGVPDGCDGFDDRDDDADGVANGADACPGAPDAYDHDGDGVPDGCDSDASDRDGDGIDVGIDNCPNTANPDQRDLDADGKGDVCDADRDGDGHSNNKELARGSDPDDPSSTP